MEPCPICKWEVFFKPRENIPRQVPFASKRMLPYANRRCSHMQTDVSVEVQDEVLRCDASRAHTMSRVLTQCLEVLTRCLEVHDALRCVQRGWKWKNIVHDAATYDASRCTMPRGVFKEDGRTLSMMPRRTVDWMQCGNLICVFCTVMIVVDDVNNSKVRTIHDKQLQMFTTTIGIIVLLRYLRLRIVED